VGAAGGRAGGHIGGALRLVGADAEPAGERRNHGAGDRAAGVDAKKRSLGAAERNQAAREQWRQAVKAVDPRRLVYVDECGTHTALTRLFARAPRGQRAYGQVPRNRGKNTTYVAALTWEGMQAPWTVEGAVDTSAFLVYVREVLGPTLQPGQIVVLDNLSVHQASSIREAILARGCELWFLPAYSPDLTPIEEAFSKLKAGLRRLGARTREGLVEAIGQVLTTITAHDAHGWFTHAGCALPAQIP
jgi:transposase